MLCATNTMNRPRYASFKNNRYIFAGNAFLAGVLDCVFYFFVQQVCDPLEASAPPVEPRDWPERTGSGSQALVEMGVMTGLTLMFALLRNTWKQPDSGKIVKLLKSITVTLMVVFNQSRNLQM